MAEDERGTQTTGPEPNKGLLWGLVALIGGAVAALVVRAKPPEEERGVFSNISSEVL
jgi:hypothetical protein